MLNTGRVSRIGFHLITGGWTSLYTLSVSVFSKAAHDFNVVVGCGIQSSTPFVDECRHDNAYAEEHCEVSPLTVSYSCCTERRYKSDDDEECCNLGFCANEAIRTCGGLF